MVMVLENWKSKLCTSYNLFTKTLQCWKYGLVVFDRSRLVQKQKTIGIGKMETTGKS